MSGAAGGVGCFLWFLKSVTLRHKSVQGAYLTPIDGTIWFFSMLLFVKIEFLGTPILVNSKIIKKNRKQANPAIFEWGRLYVKVV